jgi:sucrose-6-phosphate hydrolase SacC (GH32 family)
VKELMKLRNASVKFTPANSGTTFNLTIAGIMPQQSEWLLELELNESATQKVYVQFSNSKNEIYKIGYDVRSNQFFSDRTWAGNHSFSEKFGTAVHTAPRLQNSKLIKLHLFVDASSVELFADEGTVCMTDLIFPSTLFTKVDLMSEGGKVNLITGRCYSLKRIWK